MTDPDSETAHTRVISAVSADVFEQTVAAYQAEHPSHPLTAVQIEHARSLAMSEQLVETVNSVPGTGRATMLQLLAQAIRASGGQVVGLGLSNIAASFLAEDLEGAPAYSLTHWLNERRKARDSGHCPAEYALGPGDVLFMHDAHVATSQEREALLADAASSGSLVRFTGTPAPTNAGPAGAAR